MSVKIICDKGREKTVIEELEKVSSFPLVINQVHVGDFTIACNDVIKIIIERKTWADLTATITNPERRNNHNTLIEARASAGGIGECMIMYIIEGRIPARNSTYKGINTNCLFGYLDNKMIYDNCHIVYTASAKDTASRIVDFATKINNNVKSLEHKPTSSSTASNLGAIYKRKIVSADTLKEVMYCKIEGVSVATYNVIMDYSFARLANEDLSGLKFQSGAVFGATRDKTIKQSIMSRATCAEILASINGITPATAKKICDVIGPDIIKVLNFISTQSALDTIANIQKTEKLKVGKALAQRVIDALNMLK